MKKFTKIGILASLAGVFTVSGITLATETKTVSAYEVLTETALVDGTFEMMDGVSLKLNEDGGIRFKVKIDETVYTYINSKDVEIGFIIAPTTLLTGETNYLEMEQKLQKEADKTKIYQEDGYYVLNGCVTKVKTQNRKLDFSAVAYILNGTQVQYTAYNDLTRGDLYNVVNQATLDEYTEDIFSLASYNTWYGTEDYPIEIKNEANYDTLIDKINASNVFAGKTVKVSEGVTTTKTITNTENQPTIVEDTQEKTYSVTLNVNGGTCDALTSYTFGTGAILPIPVKEDYRFDGWFDNSEFNGEAITAIANDATGEKIYYAKWTLDPAPVTFNGIKIERTTKVKLSVVEDSTYGEVLKVNRGGGSYDSAHPELNFNSLKADKSIAAGSQLSVTLKFNSTPNNAGAKLYTWGGYSATSDVKIEDSSCGTWVTINTPIDNVDADLAFTILDEVTCTKALEYYIADIHIVDHLGTETDNGIYSFGTMNNESLTEEFGTGSKLTLSVLSDDTYGAVLKMHKEATGSWAANMAALELTLKDFVNKANAKNAGIMSENGVILRLTVKFDTIPGTAGIKLYTNLTGSHKFTSVSDYFIADSQEGKWITIDLPIIDATQNFSFTFLDETTCNLAYDVLFGKIEVIDCLDIDSTGGGIYNFGKMNLTQLNAAFGGASASGGDSTTTFTVVEDDTYGAVLKVSEAARHAYMYPFVFKTLYQDEMAEVGNYLHLRVKFLDISSKGIFTYSYYNGAYNFTNKSYKTTESDWVDLYIEITNDVQGDWYFEFFDDGRLAGSGYAGMEMLIATIEFTTTAG